MDAECLGSTIISDVKASQTLFDRISELGGRASNTQDVQVGRAEGKDQQALDRLVRQLDEQLAKSGVERTEAAH